MLCFTILFNRTDTLKSASSRGDIYVPMYVPWTHQTQHLYAVRTLKQSSVSSPIHSSRYGGKFFLSPPQLGEVML